MKKVLMLVFALACLIASGYAQKQKQYNRIKERIQDELKVSNEKADSVATIIQRFLVATQQVKTNTAMTEHDKQLALKLERKKQAADLKQLLTDAEIDKLQDLLEKYKHRRQNNREKADTSLKKYYF